MSANSFKATMEQVLSQTAELTVSKVSAKALVAAPATQPLPTVATSSGQAFCKEPAGLSRGPEGVPIERCTLGRWSRGHRCDPTVLNDRFW